MLTEEQQDVLSNQYTQALIDLNYSLVQQKIQFSSRTTISYTAASFYSALILLMVTNLGHAVLD